MNWLACLCIMFRLVTSFVSDCPLSPVHLLVAADTTVGGPGQPDQGIPPVAGLDANAISGYFKSASSHALECRQSGLKENYVFTISDAGSNKSISLVTVFDANSIATSIYMVGRDAFGIYSTCCTQEIPTNQVFFVAVALDSTNLLTYVAATSWNPLPNTFDLSLKPDFPTFRTFVGSLLTPRIRIGGAKMASCFTGKLFSWKRTIKPLAGFAVTGYLEKDRYVDAVLDYFSINPYFTMGANQRLIYDPDHPLFPNVHVAKSSATLDYKDSNWTDYTHEQGRFSFTSPRQSVVVTRVLPSPEMVIGEGYNFIISGSFSVKPRTSSIADMSTECGINPSSDKLDWFAVYNLR